MRIFTVTFIDLFAFCLTLPAFYLLFQDPQHGVLDPTTPDHLIKILYGVAVGLYSFGTFFGAPILGTMSDKHGRKKLILFALSMQMIGFVLFALSIYIKSFPLLLISRIIPGLLGNMFLLMSACVADVSPPETRTKNFGIIGMAFGLAFIIGASIGGYISNPGNHPSFGYVTPIVLSAILEVVNILFVLFFFKETLKIFTPRKIHLGTGFINIKKAFAKGNLGTMFIMIFFFSFGFSFFSQYFPAYLVDRFEFNSQQIGLMLAFFGLWIAISQGVVLRPLTNYFKSEKILKYSTPLFGISFLLLLIPDTHGWIYWLIPILAIFQGVTYPSSLGVVSNMVDDSRQGETIGINQSVQSLATAIPPIIGGFAVALNLTLPMWVAFGCCIISWIVYISFFKQET